MFWRIWPSQNILNHEKQREIESNLPIEPESMDHRTANESDKTNHNKSYKDKTLSRVLISHGLMNMPHRRRKPSLDHTIYHCGRHKLIPVDDIHWYKCKLFEDL